MKPNVNDIHQAANKKKQVNDIKTLSVHKDHNFKKYGHDKNLQ